MNKAFNKLSLTFSDGVLERDLERETFSLDTMNKTESQHDFLVVVVVVFCFVYHSMKKKKEFKMRSMKNVCLCIYLYYVPTGSTWFSHRAECRGPRELESRPPLPADPFNERERKKKDKGKRKSENLAATFPLLFCSIEHAPM